jgi:hypothetical protein
VNAFVLVIYLVVGTAQAPDMVPVLMRSMSEEDCRAAVASSPKATPGWHIDCLTLAEARERRDLGPTEMSHGDGPVNGDDTVRGGRA